jgi:aldose 1-epimerase
MRDGSGTSPAEGARVVTIADGPIEVELLPDIGARLHRLRVFGHDLLRTPADPSAHLRDPFSWGAYVMAPWCNRIAATPITVDGQMVALTPNFEDGTAIHGQVYGAPWTLKPDGTMSVRGGGDAWPWPYECRLRVAVATPVITVELSLTNLALARMPAGIGIHPWFRRPLEVRINAQQTIASNTDPRAEIEPVSGSLDLRSMRPMPPGLDAAWFDLGEPAAALRWPELGIAAMMRARADGELWIVGASPVALDAVAVEMQTHAPYGLRRLLGGEPGSMLELAPGATTRLLVELSFVRSRSRSAR